LINSLMIEGVHMGIIVLMGLVTFGLIVRVRGA
jgi:hypothetical protein